MEYTISINHLDTRAAFDCEADRAEREGFPGVARRQREVSDKLEGAVNHLVKHCPEGMHVVCEIVVKHVPSVTPYRRPR